LEDWSAWKLVEISYLMTQTSETFRVLQSTTCSRTVIEPASRCARGAMFWLDREASVATAPSGMMKKRKDGFSMFVLLFGVGVALTVSGVEAQFFRVMSSNVSMVSSAGFVGLENDCRNCLAPRLSH
jgi:hypothetical protein